MSNNLMQASVLFSIDIREREVHRPGYEEPVGRGDRISKNIIRLHLERRLQQQRFNILSHSSRKNNLFGHRVVRRDGAVPEQGSAIGLNRILEHR